MTARLAARPQPIVFRVESAEGGARDANGVAAGADVAVDRASGSSGSPLPGEVQARFESSLGTDLSSVRVHTGADSAEAPRAVGARAYTTGQDIHFAAGQYDPSSAFGTHLLAHEVAHTVQQQGETPTRQNKLEVSTPGDAHETEADHAADAMVSGELASVSRGAGLSRKLMRDDDYNNADEMQKQGAAAEKEAATSTTAVSVGKLSTVNDTSSAKKQIDEIDLNQPKVVAGSSNSEWKSASSSNVVAKCALEEFIANNDLQGAGVSNFRAQYQLAIQDFARLQAVSTTFLMENPPDKKSAPGSDPATNMAKAVDLNSADRDGMKTLVAEGGPAHALWAKARDSKDALKSKSADMAKAQTDVMASMMGVTSSQMKASAGVQTITTEDKDLKGKLETVKGQVAAAKGAWDMINKAVGDKAKAAADSALPGSGAVVGKALDAVPALIDAWYAKALSAASTAKENSDQMKGLVAVGADQMDAREKATHLKSNIMAYNNLAAEVATCRSNLENDMKLLGDKLDKAQGTNNHAYAQLTKLTGDLVRFKAQAEATLTIGKQEQSEAKATGESRDKIVSKDTGKGLPWYSVRSQTDLEKQAGVFGGSDGILVYNQLAVSAYSGGNKGGGGSAFGAGGANEKIDGALAEMEKIIGQVGPLESSLNDYLFKMV